MLRCRHILTALAALVAVALPSSVAALDDPDLDYQTIETEHFYIHYYEEVEPLAERVAQIHEEAHEILVPVLDWTPKKKTHVVINDKVDTANGSARVYGRNRVLIYGMPPEPEGVLGYYDDWLRILIYHEYVHILHLDTAHGLAPFLNRFIGKQYNPNQTLPRWYIEGLAVMLESETTGTGRVNSSLFQMWLRTAALEDRFFTLGQATGLPIEWPRGSAAYLYGGFFLDYVTERLGDDFGRDYNHLYGSRFMPYSINQAADQVGGETFHQMWRDWTTESQAEALATHVAVGAKGRTELEFITDGGGSSRYVTQRPDSDQMSFYRSDLQSHAAFSTTETSGTGHDALFKVDGATGAHDWTPDGKTLVYGRNTVVENVYTFADLYARDVETGNQRRLTHGERAREPAVSPDGERLAYVRNLHGTMELVVRPMGASLDSSPRVLAGADDFEASEEGHWQQISMPTWRPDGRALVFSRWRLDERRRDLWMYDFEAKKGERLQRLTDDAAQELDPHFGDDGLLYFASDRTGIFNAYAMDVDDDETWQLSNVTNGVFAPRPSHDGRWIYVASYTEDGYEIARFRPPSDLDTPAPESYAGPERRDYPEVDDSDWKRGPYRPLRWLEPLLFTPEASAAADGVAVGGQLEGYDPVGHHEWRVGGAFATGSQPIDRSSALSASYSHGGWPLDVGVRAGYRTLPQNRSLVAENQLIPFTERSISGGLTASYPIRSIADTLRISTSLELEYNEFAREPDLDHAPDDIDPIYPDHGWFSDVSFRLSYANTERYPQSISTADGVSASLGVQLQHDLDEFERNNITLTYGLRGYVSVPFFEHHVATLGVDGGINRSNFLGGRGFAVGGYSNQDVLTDLLLQQPRGQFVMRGYPPGYTTGSQYQVWNAEYRFPILTLDRGFSTLPVFVQRMKGAVFADAGGAFNGYLADAEYRT
ncbi:MAG: hypothetical protein ACOCV2_10125, partial [Persicimonas sp.]